MLGTYAAQTGMLQSDGQAMVVVGLAEQDRGLGAATASSISGTVTHTVTVGSGVYLSPLTITATGAVLPTARNAIGVYIPTATVGAVVVNRGHVTGQMNYYSRYGVNSYSSLGGTGIDFALRGSLFNLGTIVGGPGKYVFSYGIDGAAAVNLAGGGVILNNGLIVGGAAGGTNEGTGGGGGNGVELGSAGQVINNGTIIGGAGGFSFYDNRGGGAGVFLSSASTLINRGIITGGVPGASGFGESSQGGQGVFLAAGGWLTNDGSITGGSGDVGPLDLGGVGIELKSGGTVLNNGSVAGGAGGGWTGVVLSSGGMLTNLGIISGGDGSLGGGAGGTGVSLNGGLVVNAGTISGGTGSSGTLNGAAVQFGTVAATLVVDPGAVFNGLVVANPTVADVLELGGTGAGTISGLGASFTNFTRLAIDSRAAWSLAGSNSLASGSTLSLAVAGTLAVTGSLNVGGNLALAGRGTLAVKRTGSLEVGTAGGARSGRITVDAGSTLSGSGRLASSVVDNGTVVVAGGTILVGGALEGTGSVAIDQNTALVVGGALETQSLVFLGGGNEMLQLGTPLFATAQLSGFGAGDTIDLVRTVATAASFAGHSLTVSGVGGAVASLHFAGNYTSRNFVLRNDLHGGTDIIFRHI